MKSNAKKKTNSGLKHEFHDLKYLEVGFFHTPWIYDRFEGIITKICGKKFNVIFIIFKN